MLYLLWQLYFMDLDRFESVYDLLSVFTDEQACVDYLTLQRWQGNIISPFDPYSKVYVCKDNRYRCKNTGKYFNVKTNTLFEGSRVPLQKWFVAIWILTIDKQLITSVDLGKKLGISQKASWLMIDRIKKCFK